MVGFIEHKVQISQDSKPWNEYMSLHSVFLVTPEGEKFFDTYPDAVRILFSLGRQLERNIDRNPHDYMAWKPLGHAGGEGQVWIPINQIFTENGEPLLPAVKVMRITQATRKDPLEERSARESSIVTRAIGKFLASRTDLQDIRTPQQYAVFSRHTPLPIDEQVRRHFPNLPASDVNGMIFAIRRKDPASDWQAFDDLFADYIIRQQVKGMRIDTILQGFDRGYYDDGMGHRFPLDEPTRQVIKDRYQLILQLYEREIPEMVAACKFPYLKSGDKRKPPSTDKQVIDDIIVEIPSPGEKPIFWLIDPVHGR